MTKTGPISKATIEVLLDRVHQGVATLSPEGVVLYANQRLAQMLGVHRMQIVGRPLAELVAEPDREAFSTTLAAGYVGTAKCQVALPRADGKPVLDAHVTLAPLGHGQASCLVSERAPAPVP